MPQEVLRESMNAIKASALKDHGKIDPKLLHDCGIQPAQRTTVRSLALLSKLVAEAGGIITPILVARFDEKLWKVDGHRRCAVAEQLGIHVPYVVDRSIENLTQLEERFVKLNASTMKMTGAGYLESWAKSSDRDHFLKMLPSKGITGNIRTFVKILGVADAETWAMKSTNPCQVNQVGMVSGFIREKNLDVPTNKQILTWILRHKGSHIIRELVLLNRKADAIKLARCIQKDQAFE